MKTYHITVDGQMYEVTVEEVERNEWECLLRPNLRSRRPRLRCHRNRTSCGCSEAGSGPRYRWWKSGACPYAREKF